jgi:NAD(P)H-dependent flavin oxidoreductase YrpB (nitropropane dioxygenase family)
MGANKEMFLRMRENDFDNLNSETRALFTYVEVREANEYEENRNDEMYLKLYKEQKKAKENLQKYLFEKRHK